MIKKHPGEASMPNIFTTLKLASALTLLLVFVPAYAANEELAEEVKEDIVQNLAADPEWKDVSVHDLTLIRVNETTFRGLLEVSDAEGPQKLTVQVLVDDDNFIWEIQ